MALPKVVVPAGLAVALMAALLAGCSSSSSGGRSAPTTASAAASAGGESAQGGESGVSGTAAATTKPGIGSRPSASAGPKGGTPAAAAATGPALADPDPAVIYTFARAGSAQASRFRAASSSIKGVYSGMQVLTASRSGSGRAEVAVYTFSGQQASNTLFQAQIVSQLVKQASAAKQLHYQNIDGTQAVVGPAASSAVGYFTGDTAIVVLAHSGATAKHSLATASAVAYAYFRQPLISTSR